MSLIYEECAKCLAKARSRSKWTGGTSDEVYREFVMLGVELFAVYDPAPMCRLHFRGARWAVYEGKYRDVRAVEPVTYFRAVDIAALEQALVVEA